jgi:hypothetical protein
MRLHHTQVKKLTRWGLTPILNDNSVSVVLGGKPFTFDTGKALVGHLDGLDASGELVKLVSSRTARSGMVPRRYKKLYEATDGNCGDDLAIELRHATTATNGETGEDYTDVAAVKAITKENGCPANGKNPGHMIMNLSNRLRAMVRHNKTVYIDGSPFKGKVHAAPKRAKGVTKHKM